MYILRLLKNMQSFVALLKTMHFIEIFIYLIWVKMTWMHYEGKKTWWNIYDQPLREVIAHLSRVWALILVMFALVNTTNSYRLAFYHVNIKMVFRLISFTASFIQIVYSFQFLSVWSLCFFSFIAVMLKKCLCGPWPTLLSSSRPLGTWLCDAACIMAKTPVDVTKTDASIIIRHKTKRNERNLTCLGKLYCQIVSEK